MSPLTPDDEAACVFRPGGTRRVNVRTAAALAIGLSGLAVYLGLPTARPAMLNGLEDHAACPIPARNTSLARPGALAKGIQSLADGYIDVLQSPAISLHWWKAHGWTQRALPHHQGPASSGGALWDGWIDLELLWDVYDSCGAALGHADGRLQDLDDSYRGTAWDFANEQPSERQPPHPSAEEGLLNERSRIAASCTTAYKRTRSASSSVEPCPACGAAPLVQSLVWRMGKLADWLQQPRKPGPELLLLDAGASTGTRDEAPCMQGRHVRLVVPAVYYALFALEGDRMPKDWAQFLSLSSAAQVQAVIMHRVVASLDGERLARQLLAAAKALEGSALAVLGEQGHQGLGAMLTEYLEQHLQDKPEAASPWYRTLPFLSIDSSGSAAARRQHRELQDLSSSVESLVRNAAYARLAATHARRQARRLSLLETQRADLARGLRELLVELGSTDGMCDHARLADSQAFARTVQESASGLHAEYEFIRNRELMFGPGGVYQ